MIGYKLFKVKKKYPGQLFPLYVMTEKSIPIGVWLPAEEGPVTEDGKVKSKLGPLCFRPGWHLSDIPLAIHIGIKEDGQIKYMHDDEVWCECEFSDEINYQEEADKNGWRGDKFIAVKAMLTRIPENGYYRYKTSPMMLGKWIIAGSMKVNRVLSDEEVAAVCRSKGYEALPRKHAFMPASYGIKKMG